MTERTVVRSYSTQFERDEDPLSEDGMWVQGQTDGIDWIDVMTRDGRVFRRVGTKPARQGDGLLPGPDERVLPGGRAPPSQHDHTEQLHGL
jgi:hypothetical protein